jgi:hypothetical protein
LKRNYEVSQGLIPYDKYVGHSEETIKNRIWHANYKKDDTYKKELKGGDVRRYFIKWNGENWISYGDWLAAPREPKYFKEPRVLIREITGKRLKCSYTQKEYYNSPSIINVISNRDKNEDKQKHLKYLLAILNSKLINCYHLQTSPKAKKGLFPKIVINDVRNLPIMYDPKFEKILANKVAFIMRLKEKLYNKKQNKFKSIMAKLTSSVRKPNLEAIINNNKFFNIIYSGRARKIRDFTVNINTNIITLYSDKSSSGKYELVKFEEDDEYKRQYIKYYLENLTEEQLDEINENHSGNLLKKILQIEIPDYDKDQVVRKVVNEWESLQQEIEDLADEIEKTDKEIDQMVYDLYGLTDDEIEIVEGGKIHG